MHGGYYFRYLGNQTAVDNTLITSADYDGPFCITAPTHPDLPGGGGYPVCGLFDLKPTARGRVQNHTTFARDFGGIIDQYQGVDLGANARLGTGSFVNAGVNMQRRVLDQCNITLVDNPETRYCRTVEPYRADFKVSASHALPWRLSISGLYQWSPGPSITAAWNAPGSLIAPALGRNLSAGATSTKTVQLIQPGTLFGDSMHQVDLRLSRRFTFGRFRVRGDLNLYNAFNTDFTSSVNTTFSSTASNAFMRPTAILQGRLFKVGGQIEF